MSAALPTKKVTFTLADIGPNLLESITKGLYTNPFHVIREYVQNEIDAKPPPTQISVVIDGRNLSIRGDGCGMNDGDIQLAKRIGFSTKDPEESVGFRGIGIWSGVAVCDLLIISTKREGEYKKHALTIDASGIRHEIENRTSKNLAELLSDHITRTEVDAGALDHGTHVELRGVVKEAADLLDEDQVGRYMALVLPVQFSTEFPYRIDIDQEIRKHDKKYRSFPILLNGKPVFRPPTFSELEKARTRSIKVDGRQVAFVWYCVNKSTRIIRDENSRGFLYKWKNFTIGDRNTPLSLFRGVSPRSLMNWCVGEIHVTDSEIRPNAERIDFENSRKKSAMIRKLREELEEELQDELRDKSTRESVTKKLDSVPRSVPKELKFGSEVEKVKRLYEAVRTREQLAAYSTSIRTPSELKEQIAHALPKLDKIQKQILRAKVVPGVKASISFAPSGEAPGSQSAERDEEPEQSKTTLVDIATSLQLPQTAKTVIEVVENVIDEYFTDDDSTLYDLKQRIASQLSETVRKKV